MPSQEALALHARSEPPCIRVDPPLYLERNGPDLIEQLGLNRKNPQATDRVQYWAPALRCILSTRYKSRSSLAIL